MGVTRRGFLGVLATLPVVGKLLTQAESLPVDDKDRIHLREGITKPAIPAEQTQRMVVSYTASAMTTMLSPNFYPQPPAIDYKLLDDDDDDDEDW
jgi:hypothetical protein